MFLHRIEKPSSARIIHHLCPLIFLFVKSRTSQHHVSYSSSSSTSSSFDVKCPNAYWDEPSKRCSENLLRVLEEIKLSNHLVSAELRFNKTCREWDKANDCYQKLIQSCHKDPNALHEIQLHISRYAIFSRPCTDPSLRYRQNMADCFLPDVKSTRTCTETIDKFLRRFIVSNDYRSACRVISASMKCFHEIKDNILHRCKQEGAQEYQHRYILPLVEQTRQLVLGQCNLTHPYDEYYALYSEATPTSLSAGLLAVCSASIICRLRLQSITRCFSQVVVALHRLLNICDVSLIKMFAVSPSRVFVRFRFSSGSTRLHSMFCALHWDGAKFSNLLRSKLCSRTKPLVTLSSLCLLLFIFLGVQLHRVQIL